ncbi:hypothetical protein N7379_27265, partial [Rhizobium pusense]|uniref:hypothetical protein n=1 Tax=Agrobacterium pusense TaxID=648995 RepID=UPI00244AF530
LLYSRYGGKMGADIKNYLWDCLKMAFKWHGSLETSSGLIGSVLVTLAGALLPLFGNFGWSGEKLTYWAALVSIGVFAVNMFLISPFRLYRSHVAEIKRLKQPAALHFENSEEFIKKNRDHYQADRVDLRLDAKSRLADVRVWVESVRKFDESNALSKSWNDGSKFQLGMAYNEASFYPRNVFGSEQVVIFHHTGGLLSVFTNSNVHELASWKDNLPIGKYRFEIAIDSPSLDVAVRNTLDIEWDGNLENLSIKIL